MSLDSTPVATSAEFGIRLREERRAQRLTQAEASALAGVGLRLWNEVERGKRPQLGLETALRMLQTLGLDCAITERARAGRLAR